jgi:hypothetical protein
MFLMYFSATKYIIMCKDTFLFGISVRYVPLFSFSVHAVALASAPQSLSHRNGMTFSLHRVALSPPFFLPPQYHRADTAVSSL